VKCGVEIITNIPTHYVEILFATFYKCAGGASLKVCRVQLKPDGTRWRTWGEVKGNLANGVGSQHPSHYLGTWCIQHYYRWCAHLACQQSTELTPHADLNGLVLFAERRNLVSARVPSRFKRSLPGTFDEDRTPVLGIIIKFLAKVRAKGKGDKGIHATCDEGTEGYIRPLSRRGRVEV